MQTFKIIFAAAALAASGTAFAASATAPATPPTPTAASTGHSATAAPAMDYKARCTLLETQWDTALTANATNANLGKAKAKAATAKTKCASAKTEDQKKGVLGYENALKLVGVTPS